MTNTVLDDEMPVAPASTGDDTEVPFGGNDVDFDTTFASDAIESGIDPNTVVPTGIYHCKLTRYSKAEKINEDGLGNDPYIIATLRIMDGVYAGVVLTDFDIKLLRKHDNELFKANTPEGREIARQRMFRIKNLMKSAGFVPNKTCDVCADFLDHQPEVWVDVSKNPKREQNSRGEWVVVAGKFRNRINEYVDRPRGR